MKIFEKIARTIVDMLNTEAMVKATVAYGTIVKEIKEVSTFIQGSKNGP